MATEGPYGYVFYGGTAIPYAQSCDVLAYKKNSEAAEYNLDHAMFITGVTGTYGQRTLSNIKIAAHSGQSEGASQILSEYTSITDTDYFARAHIAKAYYAVEQD